MIFFFQGTRADSSNFMPQVFWNSGTKKKLEFEKIMMEGEKMLSGDESNI